uniref:Chromosome 10 open reading frame 53 n=1 Tax=Hucho hucho TaxID=62062 RepID=A0A4W5RLA1_9TELE
MPQNAVVIVRYGPYKSCGIVDHRTFRLIGLQAALKENGHQSVLEKMSDWNKVELVVNGECVYTCNIKQLEFGELIMLIPFPWLDTRRRWETGPPMQGGRHCCAECILRYTHTLPGDWSRG